MNEQSFTLVSVSNSLFVTDFFLVILDSLQFQRCIDILLKLNHVNLIFVLVLELHSVFKPRDFQDRTVVMDQPDFRTENT